MSSSGPASSEDEEQTVSQKNIKRRPGRPLKEWSKLSDESKRNRLYRESVKWRKQNVKREVIEPAFRICENEIEPSDIEPVDICPVVEPLINKLDETLYVPNDNLVVTKYLIDGINKIASLSSIAREPTNQLLELLHPFFPKLPRDIRTIKKTPGKVKVRNVHPGKYIHIGIKSILRILIKQTKPISNEIIMDVFADGVAFHKIGKMNNYWVILGRFEKFTNVFCIGIYNGRSSPASYNDLLKDFINESLKFINDGLLVEDKLYFLRLRNFIGDSIAQSDVAYVIGPAGRYSCPYCKVRGRRVKGRITFCDLGCDERTDNEYKDRSDEFHHREGTSDLFTKLLSFPSNSPIDYLHNVLLGSCKRFLNFAFGKKGVKDMKGLLNAAQKLQISVHITKLNDTVPSEIHHECRNLKDFGVYKASDYRIFLLKIGPTVLKALAYPEIYDAFLKLYSAITILCDPERCLSDNHVAGLLLRDFIQSCIELFGRHFVVSVVHRLIHLPDMVKQQGKPLDCFSAFPFESYIATIKKDVHSSNKVLKQIYNRRVEYLRAEPDYFTEINPAFAPLKLGRKDRNSSGDFISAKYNGFIIRANSRRDGFLLTKARKVVQCLKIKIQENGNGVSFICKEVYQLPDLFTRPIMATRLNYFYCRRNFARSDEVLEFKISDFERKLFFMPYDEETATFAPLRKFNH